tara:strand:+ start:6276 stop:6878 length:603 start_codon:yes stop_codon:yes gene_type:complete
MRRETPEVNAGSMADIAFLLLIFFLVTTTMKVDQGIFTKIPKKDQEETRILVKDKNILEVTINMNNELMVENESIKIGDLTQLAFNFIDNGGGKSLKGEVCDWCQGAKDPASSDHPSKAVIAIQSNRTAHYETYIAVLDNLHAAYTKLRNAYALKVYKMSYTDMLKEEKKGDENATLFREKILVIQKKYPLLISDSQIQG